MRDASSARSRSHARSSSRSRSVASYHRSMAAASAANLSHTNVLGLNEHIYAGWRRSKKSVSVWKAGNPFASAKRLSSSA